MSYNLNNELINKNHRKIIEKNGEISFYFKGNYFQYIVDSEIINISESDVEKLNLKIISDLISYRNTFIEKHIKDSEKNGKLRVIQNPEIFDQIYIFERKNDSIWRYPVTWLDVIECE
jgi:hypothetical protein